MSFVYFAKPVDADGPIKIGISNEPVKRLKQLMVWSPVKLEIVAAFPGDYADEAAVQGMFAADRTHGEWFNTLPRLADFISAIARGEPVDKASGEYQEAKSESRVASGIKSHMTQRVNKAERRAIGMGVAVIRPDYIRQAIAEYTGPHLPVPTAEHRALVDLYCRELAGQFTPSARTPKQGAAV